MPGDLHACLGREIKRFDDGLGYGALQVLKGCVWAVSYSL